MLSALKSGSGWFVQTSLSAYGLPRPRLSACNGFAEMGHRKTHLLIATIVLGLLLSQTASAALVQGDSLLTLTAGDALLKPFVEELLSSAVSSCASAIPIPSPSEPSGEEERPLEICPFGGLIPAEAAASNVHSQSEGGSIGAALAAAAAYLPEFSPQGSVPREAKPILPTGPPFFLLRPV
jgi:hypothetical protein